MEYEHSRTVPRYFLRTNIEITDVQSGVRSKGQTINLSLCGCCMVTSQPLPRGTSLKIVLSRGETHVETLGRVIYANAELGMGIVFTRVEPESEQILNGWISELAAKPI